MPIYNRQTLRQTLGKQYLKDTVVGRTSGSWGTQAGSLNIIDSSQADPTASGEQLFFRHWLRLLGSAGKIQDLRVGTFNTGSGAYLSAITAATTIFSGMPFEVHGKISPSDKDDVIDQAIQDVRVEQIYPMWSVDNSYLYSLGTDIKNILDLKYYSDPTNSLDRGEAQFSWWDHVTTATGQELRVKPSLPASYQLAMRVLLEVSLGAGDLATVNLPSDKHILWNAAARCYWLMEQDAPAKEAELYAKRRQQAARETSKLSKRFQPFITKKIQLDESW